MGDPSFLDFNLVDTPDHVAAFVEWFELRTNPHHGATLALDTETSGLRWYHPEEQPFCRLVQFGCSDGTGWAIPVSWHPRLLSWALGEIERTGKSVVFHNATFDQHALRTAGLPIVPWCQVHDTSIIHRIVDPLSRHALKSIAVSLLGGWAGQGQALLAEAMRKFGWDWGTVPVDFPLYWGYGVIDTVLTAMVFDALRLPSHSAEAYDREMSYLRIMYGVERRGLRIDTSYAEELLASWSFENDQARAQLRDLGVENPLSNRQVEAVLKANGWEPDAFTDTGQALLDKTVLAQLLGRAGVVSEVAGLLVDFKRRHKWMNTYLVPFIASGGRVYPGVHTMQARTGRSSITNPPLQTLPHTPHIRRAILPEEGQQLYAIDFSGQEYRLLAAFSQDPAWLHEFLHGAGDPHQLVADQLGVERSVAKTFNFALVYGAGVAKLALATGLPEGEVSAFLDQYSNTYPGIVRFKRNLESSARSNSHKATTAGGRIVQCHPDQLYAITNYVIQGSGADILKEAACRLDAAGYGEYIMLPVHDELVFSLPEGAPASEIQSIMESVDFGLPVPMKCEVSGPFENWGQAYE